MKETTFRKVWVSIKFLSAKFGVTPPPPKRAQNEKKLYKSVENPQIRHFFRGGGGGNSILWTKRFYGHLGVSDQNG